MKLLTLFFTTALIMAINAQTIPLDTNLSRWSGDKNKFVFAHGQLRLNDTAAGSASLFTPNTLTHAEWEIQLRMQFAPSASNQLKMYLATDTNITSSIQNGYYLQLGENGSLDAFELIKIKDGKKHLLLRGKEIYGAEVDSISVKVTHQPNGVWQLFTDPTGNKNYDIEGSVVDNDTIESKYFGLECLYTQTRATLFQFSNLSIKPFEPDTIGPIVNNYSITNNNSIILNINKIILFDSLCFHNILLKNESSSHINPLSPTSFEVQFNSIAPHTPLPFSIRSLYDLAGNRSDTTFIIIYEKDTLPPTIESAEIIDLDYVKIRFTKTLNLDSLYQRNFFLDNQSAIGFEVVNEQELIVQFGNIQTNTPHVFKTASIYDYLGNHSRNLSSQLMLLSPKPYEVIISELLYDPISGESGEFIELYSLSKNSINTAKLKIGKGYVDAFGNPVVESVVPLQSQILLPGNYLVLTNTNEWKNIPPNTLHTSIPRLNNTGTTVIVLNQFDEVIDYVSYDKDMHAAAIKTTKGISLEKIDLSIQNNRNNWTSASSLVGSTPGERNSSNHSFAFKNSLTIEPKTLDFNFGETSMLFSYEFETGKTGNCLLFNEKGQKVSDILVNEHLAAKGIFTWSPTDQFNIATGIYIVVWETWDNTGHKQIEKYVVSIIR